MIFVSFDTKFLQPLTDAVNGLTAAINTQGGKIVSALTDLQAEVADLGSKLSTDLGNLNTSLQAEIAAITAALGAAGGGTPDADIQAVTASLQTLGQNIDSGIGAVQSAIDAETAALAPKPPTA